MKKKFLSLLVGLGAVFTAFAQHGSPDDYGNFPLIITVQFHSLSLPFKDLKGNFSNVGLGLGTEFSYNGRRNLVQQVHGLWFHNRTVGDGLLFYTQTAWRPTIVSPFFAEAKAGAGYLYAFRPVPSFRPENGDWTAVGRRGKGMLALPVGITLGYRAFRDKTYFSPFVSYQFLLLNGYNPSIPVVPETLIQFGTGIHFK